MELVIPASGPAGWTARPKRHPLSEEAVPDPNTCQPRYGNPLVARRPRCIITIIHVAVLAFGHAARAQYHSYAQVGSILLDAQTSYPTLCQRYDLGTSTLGQPIWALCLTDNVGVEEDEPEVRYISTMHGDEVMGVEMCLNLIDYLTANYGSDPRVTNIVDEVELWIVPCMNPDGFNAGTRGNANGVDLNRNFPDPFTSPSNTTAGREAETAAIMDWSFGRSFTLAANYHGGALVVNYPYDNNPSGSSVYTASPDDDLFIWISEEYTQHNPPMWNSSVFLNGITNGAAWYAISGGMQDWSYRYLGANAVTIEVSNVKTPPASQIPQFWNENRESMLAYIETCLIGVRGLVIDGATGDPLPATIRVAGRGQDVDTDPDVGDYHRMLLTGTYDLTFASDGYDGVTKTGIGVSGANATRLDVALWNTTVSFPNGGETLPGGTPESVTWTGSPDAQFHVQYTANASDAAVITDDFDGGVFDPDYHTGGHEAWAVDSANTHGGPFAARSGAIANGEVSWIFRTMDCSEVRFWYDVSSEAGGDFFSFYVDGDRLIHASGTGGGWTYFSTTVTPGSHQLMWEYAKDSGGIDGADAVWIDDLETVFDQAIWSDVIALTAPGASSTPWTPAADGADFKVRVRAYYDGGSWGSWDQSDATFAVSAAAVPGDFDTDLDVDQDDYLMFESCFTGPDGGPVDPGCQPGDFDLDNDIDCDDWAQFLSAWTEPGDPPGLDACPQAETIPTVSTWGLVTTSLILLAVGSTIIRRRGPGLSDVRRSRP